MRGCVGSILRWVMETMYRSPVSGLSSSGSRAHWMPPISPEYETEPTLNSVSVLTCSPLFRMVARSAFPALTLKGRVSISRSFKLLASL